MNRPKPFRTVGRLLALLGASALAGCTAAPSGVRPVTGFDAERYLGKWYEIARLDHSFERGLTNVSATYTPLENGGIRVVNRGWNPEKGKWKQAEGRAYFTGDPDTGSLKVSFFGPFFGGYHVIALDQAHYAYAMVCGPNRSYLWILAREKSLPEPVRNVLTAQAREAGFDVNGLIWVSHDRDDS
jgi:apolipoprotein D and lipocalin family protein